MNLNDNLYLGTNTCSRFTNPLDKNANQKLQEGVMGFVRLAPSLAIAGAEVGEGKYKLAEAFSVNLVLESFKWKRCKDSLSNIPIPETGISNL